MTCKYPYLVARKLWAGSIGDSKISWLDDACEKLNRRIIRAEMKQLCNGWDNEGEVTHLHGLPDDEIRLAVCKVMLDSYKISYDEKELVMEIKEQ